MANLNKVFLMGNLTRDPELRSVNGGTSVCEFGVAINRTWIKPDGTKGEETCFVDCTMWGRRGEVIAESLSKGQPIFVEGHMKLDEWENQQGEKRSKLKIVADNFEFLGGKESKGYDTGRAQARTPQRPISIRNTPPGSGIPF